MRPHRMKLQQGQVWHCGQEYVRIVQLERLEVGYKSATNPKFTDGEHRHTSKKDFCRLLKGATLISPLPPAKAVPGQENTVLPGDPPAPAPAISAPPTVP